MTRRYTDTTLTLLVKNTNLNSARSVYVTICQYSPDDLASSNFSSMTAGINNYTKEEITLPAYSVSYSSPNAIVLCNLTQEQNAKFKEGHVRVQVNWIDSSGKRKATVVKRLHHYENLHEEVI